MRVEHHLPELAIEPQMCLQYEQHLAMALSPGWVEVGQRRSEMKKTNLGAGEMAVCPRHQGMAWSSLHGAFDRDRF
ncbi:MAG: hypothetical protein JO217_04565 [Acidobacteriaceae bacterium]|nr:hypothetical protein [Acidobacteriaceae bacterium]